MARQRPRKTYLSAVQRAERQTVAEGGEDGEGGRTHHHRRRYRRPPPRFSDLFVKKKEHKDEGYSSKENVTPLQTGGKVEGSFEQSQTSQAFRRVFTEVSITNSTTTSGPSFNDTFDKVFGRTGPAAKPQVPLQNPCSSSSESHLEGSGLLFKSLMSSASSWVADKSVWRSSRVTNNNNAQTQKKNRRLAEYNNNNNKSSGKEKTKQTSKPLVFSPQLFTSVDMVMADKGDEEDADKKYEVSDNSPQSFPSSPPISKARTLGWRTRRKQASYRQRATETTKGASSSSHATKSKTKTDSSKAALLMKLPTNHPPPPSVQPSPLVQQSLLSQGIVCPPPHQSSPTIPPSFTPPMDEGTVPPQIKMSGSLYLAEKLSCKSSIHTSTPTERSRLLTTSRKGSKWSASASPSLEMKLSPVPREEDMVTDNSSVFQSPSLPTEVSKGQAQGEPGGSPSLPSKYETCTSSGRLGQEVSSSTSCQEFVTGETGDKGSRSPSYYNGSIRITRGPFKGAKIPTLTFDSPQQDTPPLHQDGLLQGSGSHANPLRLDTSELSPIIKRQTRAQKNVKRLGKSSHNFPTKQSPEATRRARKTLPSWLAKRFSPTVTRSRSRLLGQLSEESHSTDQSHFENTLDKNDKSTERGHKHGMNQNRGNVSKTESKGLALQKTESTLETDDDKESTTGSFPPLEESSVVEEKQQPLRQTKRTSMVSRGGSRSSCGLPPIARRSVRFSRKLNPTGVSVPRRRTTRLSSLIHKSQEGSISRSRKVDEEPPIKFSLSNYSSSPVIFQPRRGRRDNQLVFYRPDSSQSTTLSSVSSSPGVSLSHPPFDTQHTQASPIRQLAFLSSSQHPAGTMGREGKALSPEALQQTTREEGSGTVIESNWPRRVSCGDGGDEAGAKECVFKQPLVLLRKLEESAHYSINSNRSESVLPPLPPMPAKPGKGWRRSIAIRARAASLTALEQVTDMPPLRTPTSITPGPPKRMSHLRMSSFPTELSPRFPLLGSTCLDSPRRSVLQMSFRSEAGKVAPSVPVPHDPRQQVLELCSQEEPLPFTQCFTDSRLASCRKIGEGVYGEVFMTQPDPGSLEGARVLKVMPIEGNFPVNGEPQKKFEEILSEMVISLELSGLRAMDRQLSVTENFVHVQASWCVEGAYPQDLLHLWDLFKEEKGSENDRPDIFPDTQLYVVLEFGHGGRDLESFVFNNARDLMGVFLQIAYSLAVAEEVLEFEHRDLHWGNVLVAPTSEAKINFKLGGETFDLNTYGLKATVIDFTLSRIKLPKCIVFNNLAEDPSLFTSEGDYQFEVYRLMQHTNNNDWETFKPYTNVLWLHYLLVKMTSECYIKNTNTKVHRSHHAQLMKMKDAMLSYESALHFLLSREEK